MTNFFRLIFFVFLFATTHNTWSQVHPAENSTLNYRLVGFAIDNFEKGRKYIIEIAKGDFSSEVEFKKHICVSEKTFVKKNVIEVPEFGKAYTWRVGETNSKGEIKNSRFYHFSTGYSEMVDTTCMRLRVVTNKGKYKGAYVFLDQGKVLYDMNGAPVWYLPTIDSVVNERCLPRDMKVTPHGTITFIAFGKLYEITYDGKVVWTTKANKLKALDQKDRFHHEFTMLKNGHYMAMGMEPVSMVVKNIGNSKIPVGADKQMVEGHVPPAGMPLKFQSGKLIEFDANGKEVWSWLSSQYFSEQGSDFAYNKLPDGSINTDVHDNSFFFDEAGKCIYISYKNLNRILKIKYPEGTVLAVYGEKYRPDFTPEYNGMFCGQHCIKKSVNGNIYVFNNNICNHDEFPKVAVMKEPEKNGEQLKLVWEYTCNNAGIGPDENRNIRSLAGGSVEELPDSSMLVCMGTPCAKVFIVNQKKEEIWSAFSEIWKNELNKWQLMAIYRTSIIFNKQELGKLVWQGDD